MEQQPYYITTTIIIKVPNKTGSCDPSKKLDKL